MGLGVLGDWKLNTSSSTYICVATGDNGGEGGIIKIAKNDSLEFIAETFFHYCFFFLLQYDQFVDGYMVWVVYNCGIRIRSYDRPLENSQVRVSERWYDVLMKHYCFDFFSRSGDISRSSSVHPLAFTPS